MGSETGIEWTNSTWNWVRGCKRVSPGCARCYAEKVVNTRMRGDFRLIQRAPEHIFQEPLHWRKPRRIFSCSISDFFIEEADPWRPEVWDIIRQCQQHTFQILTKRPERIRAHLPPDWGLTGYPNVWLGVSGETYDFAYRRGAILREIPARVRFLSAEPWLDVAGGPVRARSIAEMVHAFYDWVILGGESGPGCRSMDMESAREVIAGVKRAEVPLFLKQLGGAPDPKSHAKAIIDGRTWKEYPLSTPTGH